MTHKVKMTSTEFLELPETTQPTELIDGEMIVSPAAVPNHQRRKRRFVRQIEDLIPNGEVFDAPADIYFDEENTVQPDIFWVAENSRVMKAKNTSSARLI